MSCPLDVIKTKLQAQGGFRAQKAKEPGTLSSAAYRGVRGTAQTIWREEGLRGMYRGLGPMLLGYVPTWAVYLTVYNEAQHYFNTKTGKIYDIFMISMIGLTFNSRQQISGKHVFIFGRRDMFNTGNESNLGDQNEVNVSIEFKSK